MKQWVKGSFLYCVAGSLLILDYLSLWFSDTSVDIQLLRYVGGAILVVGIVFIFLLDLFFAVRANRKRERIGPTQLL